MKKRILLFCFILVTTIPTFGQCWESVAVGYANVFAIADNGTLWAWGKNTFGELGDGTNVLKNSPVQIGTDTNWKEVSPSMDGIYSFTLAVKTDGTLWSWGSNNRGQLGDGTTVFRNYPMQVGTDTDWSTVAAGLSHSIAIKQNGTLWGWGNSERFSLIGFPSGPNVLVPEQRSLDTDWREASAHDRVTVAVKTNNTAWGWGWNQNDMLKAPAGATIAGNVQNPVQKLGGTNVKHTRTGDRINFDIKTNNNVGTTNSPYFVRDADTGVSTSVYIRLDNSTLWFTGIIQGSTNPNIQPLTQLGTAANWVAVSVGSQCNAAINSAGEIWTWGSNFHGGLGIGVNSTASSSTVPVLVPCPTVLSNPRHDLKVALQLYPNPVQNIFSLESDLAIDRLIIFDIMGKELFNQTFSNLTIDVDVSQFLDGLYIVQAFSGNSFSQIKFIKN